MTIEKPEQLLTPGEVALMFRVESQTVTRWTLAGEAASGLSGGPEAPAGSVSPGDLVRGLLADLTVRSSPSTA